MLKKTLCVSALFCAVTFSNAAVLTFTDTVDVATTNFTTSVELSKFDNLGGSRILNSVTFKIDGDIFGSAVVENRDTAAATIVSTLAAELTLIDALNNTLVVTMPSITNTFNASPFDGSLDFGGTSGMSYLDLTASQTNQETYINTDTLAFFTGAGMASFIFDANATSSATGAGNLTSGFSASAGGLVSVIYDYTDIPIAVAAPSSIALIGLAVLAFFGFRKFRQ